MPSDIAVAAAKQIDEGLLLRLDPYQLINVAECIDNNLDELRHDLFGEMGIIESARMWRKERDELRTANERLNEQLIESLNLAGQRRVEVKRLKALLKGKS